MRLSNIFLLLVLAITAIVASASALQSDTSLVQGGQRGVISGGEKMMEETQTRRVLKSEGVPGVGLVVKGWGKMRETLQQLFTLLKDFLKKITGKSSTTEGSVKKTASVKSGSSSKKEVSNEGSAKTVTTENKNVASPSSRMLRSEVVPRFTFLQNGWGKMKEMFQRLFTLLKDFLRKITGKSSTTEGSVKKAASVKSGSHSNKATNVEKEGSIEKESLKKEETIATPSGN